MITPACRRRCSLIDGGPAHPAVAVVALYHGGSRRTEGAGLIQGEIMVDFLSFYSQYIKQLSITGKWGLGLCPFHDDHNPSFAVDIESGGWHCKATCGSGNITEFAKRLDLPDPFANDRPAAKAKITATYDYRDEHGKLLFQVLRFEPKDFRQRRPLTEHPTRSEDWEWKLGETRRVLYRLPELLAMADPVLLVEGEKDVDRLLTLGITATTNPHGAGKWKPEYTAALTGRHVVLIPDNDPAGKQHAQQVITSLLPITKRLDVVSLSTYKDVSEFLTDSVEDPATNLRRLIAGAVTLPKSEITQGTLLIGENGINPGLIHLDTVVPIPIRWLWPGYIPRGKITLIDGDPGLGKSLLTLDLAARVSTGRSFPDGKPSEKGGVVILTMEDSLADTVVPRLNAAGGSNLVKIVALQTVKDQKLGERFPILTDIPALKQAVKEVDARLVIFDPLMAYLAPKTDYFKDQDIRQQFAPLARFAEEMDLAILVVRHLTKGGGAAIYRGQGSIGITGAARCVLLVAKDPENELHRVLAGIKNNLAPPPQSLTFGITDHDGSAKLVWWGASSSSADQLLAGAAQNNEERSELEEAKGFLRQILLDGQLSFNEIKQQARAAGITEITLRRAKTMLGITSKKIGSLWVWSLPPLSQQPDEPF